MQSHSRSVRRRQVLGGAAALLAGGAGSLLHLPHVAATPPLLSFTTNSYPTGTSPYSMALGDLNRNGFPDLLIANSGSGNVTMLLNNGTGILTPATNSPFPVPGGVSRVGTGDFFKTGKTAIAVFGYNHLTIYPNTTTDGSNTIALGTGVVTNIAGSAFAIGDVNRDGIPDIVVADIAVSPPAPLNTGTITTLFGKGNRTFRVGSTFPVPGVVRALDLVDLNGDAFLDLLVSSTASNTRNDQIYAYLQTPRGELAPAAGSPYTTDTYSGTADIAILVPGQPPVIAVPCAGTNTINLDLRFSERCSVRELGWGWPGPRPAEYELQFAGRSSSRGSSSGSSSSQLQPIRPTRIAHRSLAEWASRHTQSQSR